MSSTAARRRRPVEGRDVLAMVLAFFAAVFAVNGFMIYAAVSTHTGLVANEPYRKGLAYNERIAADERQAQLGWFEQLEFSRDGRLLLTLAQRDSRPVQGLKVEGVLGRPASNHRDVLLRFIEMAPGHYQALAPGMPAGSWLITLEARPSDGAEPIFRLRRRLWLKP